ncbi:MAG: Dyp-type peroxidase, partial [Pseudomonadota bacterium]|nr:Dyp-type peroxidase [Pseudomonadota bacterium]
MSGRPIELDEIQGNILAGFNTEVQIFAGLALDAAADTNAATAWLSSLAPKVTSAADIRHQRQQMRLLESVQPWCCVALSAQLLRRIAPDVFIRDDAFNGGMARRAPSALGDDLASWTIGKEPAPVDLLLVVASNEEAAAGARAAELIEAGRQAGFRATWRETGRRIEDREHFGFRDGISQPAVSGFDEAGEMEPGNFIFGYPRETGGAPYWPAVDPRGITDNGSLLVLRRLRQDVPAFRAYCAEQSAAASTQWPALTPELFAALLVGRWPSGSPVEAGVLADPAATPPGNSFDFRDDLEAASCPFGAHIRKVNPRAGPKDVLNVPRMLRRGVPFGPTFDEAGEDAERGLMFVAFQSSIKEQFEFISRNWMNNPTNPARGSDLLVGRGPAPRTIDLPSPNGALQVHQP